MRPREHTHGDQTGKKDDENGTHWKKVDIARNKHCVFSFDSLQIRLYGKWCYYREVAFKM